MSGDSIKIVNGALHDADDQIVLRGVIDPSSLSNLHIGPYQRETLQPAKIAKLMDAHRFGRVPDVELGMRGERFIERNGVFYLQDPVFIVDGQQRCTAANRLMQLEPSAAPCIGALIHFGTNERWERERFDILNLTQTKLSSNVTLRNLRHDYTVVDTLYKLTHDRTFVLNERVCWDQNMRRGQLISAVLFFKVVGMLHSHLGPGRSNNVVDLARGLQKIYDEIGKTTFVANVRAFFDTIDTCYGVKSVAYSSAAVQLRQVFMLALAKLFTEHTSFWKDESKFFVEAPLIRKLSMFPVTDPTVQSLASSSGKALDMLFTLFVEHVNSGKRTRRLVRRGYVELVPTSEAYLMTDESD